MANFAKVCSQGWAIFLHDALSFISDDCHRLSGNLKNVNEEEFKTIKRGLYRFAAKYGSKPFPHLSEARYERQETID